tara:strand:- start:403 stop:843 length:441 start_codon:yes stop_codon:yes gene_type:complete
MYKTHAIYRIDSTEKRDRDMKTEDKLKKLMKEISEVVEEIGAAAFYQELRTAGIKKPGHVTTTEDIAKSGRFLKKVLSTLKLNSEFKQSFQGPRFVVTQFIENSMVIATRVHDDKEVVMDANDEVFIRRKYAGKNDSDNVMVYRLR